MMRRGREAGFFVTYNHPVWSLEDRRDYSGYEGMHAMEVCNWGCVVDGYDDYVPQVYDDLLRQGKKIYCVGTDDNHNAIEDSFGAFTVIKAEKLDYKTITDAMLAGNFYASMAPEIHELSIEDGTLHIETSPCEKIMIQSACRRTRVIYADSPNAALTKADIDLKRFAQAGYVRVIVFDNRGRRAWSQPIYIDAQN